MGQAGPQLDALSDVLPQSQGLEPQGLCLCLMAGRPCLGRAGNASGRGGGGRGGGGLWVSCARVWKLK